MSAEVVTHPAVGATDRRRWFALGVIVTAQFMVVLDISIVNVALPSIKTDLNFSQESLQWVITAYSIFFGGFLLLGGRLADLLGRRRLFMAGLLLFTVSSLLDGLAWSEGSLIAFRGLQGLGAAMMSPAALSILTTTFDEGRERNRALGIWGAVAGSGGAVGVLLGGVLTSAFSWPWIFYVNVPVGAAVIAVSPWLLRESRADLPNRYFDFAGAATITSGLMLLVYGMTARHSTRVGDTRDHRSLDGLRGSDRLVLPNRVTHEGASVAATHLAAADARGVEPKRSDRDQRGLLTVLSADAVHAAGPALLSAQDRGRLHRADGDDHRPLGCRARTRDEARSQERFARRVDAFDGRPRALRATAGSRPLLPQPVPGLHHQRARARLRLHTDVDRRPHWSPPRGCRNRLRVDQHHPADRRCDRRRGCHDDRDHLHRALRGLSCGDQCVQRRCAHARLPDRVLRPRCYRRGGRRARGTADRASTGPGRARTRSRRAPGRRRFAAHPGLPDRRRLGGPARSQLTATSCEHPKEKAMTKDLGVWTADDCALVLIDYQKEMFEVIRSWRYRRMS